MDEILKAIEEYREKNHETAFILLGVNVKSQEVLGIATGETSLLMSGFANRMESHKDFNNLMKALMGAYLTRNPKEKEDFLKGLEFVKTISSLN